MMPIIWKQGAMLTMEQRMINSQGKSVIYLQATDTPFTSKITTLHYQLSIVCVVDRRNQTNVFPGSLSKPYKEED
jgi:hypothetical protein